MKAWARASVLFVLYVAAARAGLLLASVHDRASPVWPAAGIALAAVYLWGPRMVPVVAVAAAVANYWAQGQIATSAVIGLGNAAEAALGGWLLWHLHQGRPWRQARTALSFPAVVAGAALVSPLVGVGALVALDGLPWNMAAQVFATWYLGDALGMLLVAPTWILFAQQDTAAWDARKWEMPALAAATGVTAIIAFGPWSEVGLALLALAPVLWAADRFDARVATGTASLMGFVAVLSAAWYGGSDAALLADQAIAAMLVILGLGFGLVVRERSHALAMLADRRANLEEVVQERTAALESTMEELQGAQRAAGIGHWTFDATSGKVTVDEALQAMIDIPKETYPSQWTEFFPKEKRALAVASAMGSVLRGKDFTIDLPVVGRHGERIIRASAHLRHGVQWHGTVQDVTEGHRAHEATARLESIVDASPIAIIHTSSDGQILSWNPAAQELSGHTEKQMIGQTIDELVRADERSMTSTAFDAALIGRRASIRIHLGFESNVPVEATYSPIRDDKSFVTGVLVTWRDLRPEEEARKQADQLRSLEEVNQFKSEFLNMASHELRTPLTPIRMQLHMLDNERLGPVNDAQHRSIGLVQRNMERLSSLVDDVFIAARLQSGRMRYEPAWLDISSALSEAAESFQIQAEEKGVTLDVEVTEGRVWGDRDRLSQVVVNLISNALKFTPEGGRIAVRGGTVNRQAWFEVEDAGPGLPQDSAKTLFQPFSQLDAGKKVGGTGLGLYISRGCMALHNGRLDIMEPGGLGGARFRATWPKSPRPKREVAQQEQEEKVGEAHVAAPATVTDR